MDKITSFKNFIDETLTLKSINTIKSQVSPKMYTMTLEDPEVATFQMIAALYVHTGVHPFELIRKYSLGKKRLSKIDLKMWEMNYTEISAANEIAA